MINPKHIDMKAQLNRERIIELRTTYPEMTLSAIGNEVSLTRERVRQILVKAKLPTSSLNGHTTKSKPIKPCKQCGSTNKQLTNRHSTYCSIKCFKIGLVNARKQKRDNNPYHWTTYQCAYCGNDKTIKTTRYKIQKRKYQNQYCSRSCNIIAQWADANSLMSNRTNLRAKRLIDLDSNIGYNNNKVIKDNYGKNIL